MHRPAFLALLCVILTLPACAASSLEQIVETRREDRIVRANAHRPLTHGAADGLGFSIAESAPEGVTLRPAKPTNTP